MKRIPQLPADKMAVNLSYAYIRPIPVAKMNLELAKTKAQVAYWQHVIAKLRTLCD
jgi:hypothetical protein